MLYVAEILFGWVNVVLEVANRLLPYFFPTVAQSVEEMIKHGHDLLAETVLVQLHTFCKNVLATIRCYSHSVVRRVIWDGIWEETSFENGFWPNQVGCCYLLPGS